MLLGKRNHVSSSSLKMIEPILMNITPNQMKIHAYELAVIFENAFDQLDIIEKSFSRTDFNANHYQYSFDDRIIDNLQRISLLSDNVENSSILSKQSEIFTY